MTLRRATENAVMLIQEKVETEEIKKERICRVHINILLTVLSTTCSICNNGDLLKEYIYLYQYTHLFALN